MIGQNFVEAPDRFRGYCLLKRDFKLLRRGLKILCRVSSIPLSVLIRRACDTHIDSCLKFAQRILDEPTHPLHSELPACRSHTSMRSQFRYLPSRINVYKNSPIPYLARVLTDKQKVQSELYNNFES